MSPKLMSRHTFTLCINKLKKPMESDLVEMETKQKA